MKRNVNKIWNTSIPRTNKFIFILSLILVFGIDLLIVFSQPALWQLWVIMVGILVLFVLLYLIEDKILRSLFSDSSSWLDMILAIFILFRNLLFLANFIPVVQLWGLQIFKEWGIFILAIYVVLIFMRKYLFSNSIREN